MPTAATKSRPIVVLASQVKSTFEIAGGGDSRRDSGKRF
jgi:hypothetical protein